MAQILKHPGFDRVVHHVMHERNPRTGRNYTEAEARAIVASRTRHASAAAKRRNPRLHRVPGA